MVKVEVVMVKTMVGGIATRFASDGGINDDIKCRWLHRKVGGTRLMGFDDGGKR